jgi:hypothetical protein
MRLTTKTNALILAGATILSLGGYIIWSGIHYRAGFPLDDAWIHQTYARNLAYFGEWAFNPGEISAGSTAPLWSVMLSIGHLIRVGPYAWTFFLGGILLWVIALISERAIRVQNKDEKTQLPWIGLFLIFEWHLVWAAGSGMETLLFGFLITFVLVLLFTGYRNWLILGMMIGIALWVRPDGVTLLAPASLVIIFKERSWSNRIRSLGLLIAGFSFLLIPYLSFNQLTGNSWLPTTFQAKQTEYAILRERPFLSRYGEQLILPLIGSGALLIPGILVFAYKSFRGNDWGAVFGLLWLFGYFGLYAWRLPVTYQHGRYIIPIMPMFFTLGLLGTKEIWRLFASRKMGYIFSKAWKLSIVCLLAVFWLLGANAYANDVTIIEREMVEPAKWVSDSTEKTALIAAHDIGALGFFGERRILDLAGLISPEVIPFIRDENELRSFIDEKNADYLLVTFNWYPELIQGREIIYSGEDLLDTPHEYAPTRMYKWKDH